MLWLSRAKYLCVSVILITEYLLVSLWKVKGIGILSGAIYGTRSTLVPLSFSWANKESRWHSWFFVLFCFVYLHFLAKQLDHFFCVSCLGCPVWKILVGCVATNPGVFLRCVCYKGGWYGCAPFLHLLSTIQQELKSSSTESCPFRSQCCCRKYRVSCSILRGCSAFCTMAARLMATVVFL